MNKPLECGALAPLSRPQLAADGRQQAAGQKAAASRRTPKAVIALLVAAFAFCVAADEVADSRKLQQEAIAAFKAKDLPLFLEKIHAAAARRPQHPSMQYQLATAYALNGRTDEALDVLERVARM